MTAEYQTEEAYWIAQARTGDTEAFGNIVERHTDTVHDLAHRILDDPQSARAAVAEVFRRASSQLGALDPAHDVAAWLQELCRSYCTQYIQQLAEHEQHAEEIEWIMRARGGSHEAFALLFERYKSAVYTHAYYRLSHAHDAQDAVQEIFRRAYVRLDTFDTSRRFRAWLMTIANNYCIDVLRKRVSVRKLFHDVPLDVVDFHLSATDDTPERSFQRYEQREQVRQAVQRLPEKYRTIVLLFYWNDLSYNEIREVTGLSESAIKTRLHRAREKLTALLAAREEDKT